MEDHLVTAALRFKPVSKKWCEKNGGKRIKANVWSCQGQDLLQRMCPCSCGGSLRKEEPAGIALPKSVVRKKSMPTAFEASSSSSHQRVTKFPYPSLKKDLPRVKSISEPTSGRLKEDEDASKQLFVSGIPREISKQDLLQCFRDFGEVVNLSISSLLPYFGFVTFDTPESVEKALSSAPILLFGRHRLNVQRKISQYGENEPVVKTETEENSWEGDDRNDSNEHQNFSSSILSPSSSARGSEQEQGPEKPILVNQDATKKGGLEPLDGFENQGSEISTTAEIYWSDDEAERGEFDLMTDNSSEEGSLSDLEILFQAQAYLEQERLQWIGERRKLKQSG